MIFNDFTTFEHILCLFKLKMIVKTNAEWNTVFSL